MRPNRGMPSAGSFNAQIATQHRPSRLKWLLVAAAVFIAATSQPGCFFRKNKVAEPQARPPARIVLLPMNVDNQELRWLALATPVLIAQAAEGSPELEIVPLWESMPVTKETVGESRTITAENAEYIGSRLTARWATQGNITADKEGISILLDFIPSRATLVPFRYEKKGSVSSIGNYLGEAVEQFLRYLVAAPPANEKPVDPNATRSVADAIDREYGWFVDAQPGQSESLVAGFARTNPRIAGLLFNPNLYPGIGNTPAAAPRVPAKPQATPADTPPQTAPGAPDKPAPPATPPDRSAVEPARDPQPVEVVESGSPDTSAAAVNATPPEPEDLKTKTVEPAGPGPPPRPIPKAYSPGVTPCRIQVFASRSKSEAEAFSARLSGAGLQPELEKANLKDKGIWYRVRLQGYASRKAAAAAGNKLRADRLIQDYWIIR